MHATDPQRADTRASPASAFLLGIIGVAIFSGTLPFTRLAIADYSPWFITFTRALIGAIPALLWLIFSGRKIRHPDNLMVFVSGVLLIFGFPGFMAMAMTSVPAAHGGIVLGIAPLATAFISTLATGERQSVKFWLLSATGATIVIGFAITKSSAGFEGIKIGYIWMIAAALCAACGYVISGKLSRSMAGYEVICRSLVLNLPLIAGGSILTWQPEFASPSFSGLVAMIYLGLFSMFIGFFAWNTALARGGIGKVGQIQLLQIFFTLAISAAMLGEQIDSVTKGCAIAVTAIVFLARRS